MLPTYARMRILRIPSLKSQIQWIKKLEIYGGSGSTRFLLRKNCHSDILFFRCRIGQCLRVWSDYNRQINSVVAQRNPSSFRQSSGKSPNRRRETSSPFFGNGRKIRDSARQSWESSAWIVDGFAREKWDSVGALTSLFVFLVLFEARDTGLGNRYIRVPSASPSAAFFRKVLSLPFPGFHFWRIVASRSLCFPNRFSFRGGIFFFCKKKILVDPSNDAASFCTVSLHC